jgi:ABC-type transporter Mla MlaB component
MDTLDIRDGADEVRVEICGSLSDSRVEELFQAWQRSMSHVFWRRFVVNLSGLAGYDAAGHALLHQMHESGVIFAAATPESLHYLDEISRPTSVVDIAAPRRGVERAMPGHRHSARSASGLPLASRAGVR